MGVLKYVNMPCQGCLVGVLAWREAAPTANGQKRIKVNLE